MYISCKDGEYHIMSDSHTELGIISDAMNIRIAYEKLADIIIDKVKEKGDYGDFLLSMLLK